MWKTVEHAEEKLALLIFQFLFQISIDIFTEQVEEWIVKFPDSNISLNETTISALLFIRSVLQRDHCGMLIPCFFRTIIVKGGMMAKFYSHLYLQK